MKLKGPINNRLIVNRFVNYYGKDTLNEDIDGESINGGQCMEWAYVAYLLYDGVELMSNQVHAFIKRGELYYDVEVPNGVGSPALIPFNHNQPTLVARSQTVEEFKDHWDGIGVNWACLEELIEDFIKESQMNVPDLFLLPKH